jgi:methyl-accepting chemotaxis protein
MIMSCKSLHTLFPVTLAAAAGAAAAGIGLWLGDGTAGPLVLAALAGASGGLAMKAAGAFAAGRRNRLLHGMAQEADRIMIGAAETSHFVDSIRKKIVQDVRTADTIVASSARNAATTEQIARNAERASKVAAGVRDESMAGAIEVDRALRQIDEARRDAEAACAMLAELQQRSLRIRGITELINDISTQTGLLALNAAIEAAHAGAHGRGFSVVAGEVRQLAQRTRSASNDIAVMVSEIGQGAEHATGGMAALNDKVAEAAQNVERVHAFLANIERLASASETEIQEIAGATREHVDISASIAGAITDIRDSMLSTEAELPRATDSAMTLAERGEALFETLADAGVATAHDRIREVAQTAAQEVERLFAQAIADAVITEQALFDRNYQAVPNTDPPKHTTAFDAFTDRVLPALQEKILEELPQLAYAGAVDDNGYFPTHNRKFSQRLTGDYQTDLVNNRTKRIFNDRTGTRCGANTRPFLLQTYKRDTGEVMHDLSVPIYVNGRHWGGFRIGYRSLETAAPAAPRPAFGQRRASLPLAA